MKLGYVSAIDGLRAVAVLAVMLYHLDSNLLPGGFSGVDVFFVISGYVVTRSLLLYQEDSFYKFVAKFYARRVKRILPALVICLLATSLATVLFIPSSWLSATTSQTGLFAFFGLSNIALVLFQDDYFSPRAEYNPFVHTWSLGVEEQFYLVFPFLFMLGVGLLHHRKSKLGLYVIALLALASLYAAYWMGEYKTEWAYYLLPSRFWELAAGALLCLAQYQGYLKPITSKSAHWFLILGLAGIAAGYWCADRANFPFPWALLPVVGTVFTLYALTNCENKGGMGFLYKGLTAPVTIYCGLISFSLYLWHWPVYTLMRWTLGLDTAWTIIAAVIITVVLSVASYHLVEKPVREAKWLKSRHGVSVLAGVAGVVICWGIALQMFERREALSLSTTADTYTWYPYAYPSAEPEAKTPDYTDRQMFVIGNSHTGAYSTLLELLSTQTGVRVHKMETGHCALGNMLYPVSGLAGCENTATQYLDRVKQSARPGDVVFLASLRTYRLSDQWVRNDPEAVLAHSQSELAIKQIGEAYSETKHLIAQLHEMGLKVLIDAPKPVLKAAPYRCSDWFNRMNPVCGDGLSVAREYMESLRAPVVSSMQHLVNELEEVYYWDPLPRLCTANECSAYDRDGAPLFFDGDHLSGHGNRVLYPEFLDEVKRIWSKT